MICPRCHREVVNGVYCPHCGARLAPAPPANTEAQTALTWAWVLSIMSFIILPIILGPLAIYYANKAEALGQPAVWPRVLGTITTIISAAIIFVSLILAAAASNGYGY